MTEYVFRFKRPVQVSAPMCDHAAAPNKVGGDASFVVEGSGLEVAWTKRAGVVALCLLASACSAGDVGSARPAKPAAPSGVTAADATAGARAGTPGSAGPLISASAGTPAAAPAADNGADAGSDECGRQHFDVRRKPADVLLVLDRSGSMKDEVDDDVDDSPSKWDVVVPALKEVIGVTDNSVSWGLKLFPEGDETGECSDDSYPRTIAVPIKPTNAGAVNQAITSTEPRGDGTPTSDAVDEGVKYLNGLSDQSVKYILLATDGAPSCAGKTKDSGDARTAAVAAVQRAADSGIHTFVIGIATGEGSAHKTLTELAKAGREAPGSGYYLASTKDELVSAVRAITSAVASCRFPLKSAPPNPDHVGVLIGQQRIRQDPNGKDGWRYVDAQRTAIELFGPACEAVKSSGADSVNVVFGCKSDTLF